MPREVFTTNVTYTDADGEEQTHASEYGSEPAVLNAMRQLLRDGATALSLTVVREVPDE